KVLSLIVGMTSGIVSLKLPARNSANRFSKHATCSSAFRNPSRCQFNCGSAHEHYVVRNFKRPKADELCCHCETHRRRDDHACNVPNPWIAHRRFFLSQGPEMDQPETIEEQ